MFICINCEHRFVYRGLLCKIECPSCGKGLVYITTVKEYEQRTKR